MDKLKKKKNHDTTVGIYIYVLPSPQAKHTYILYSILTNLGMYVYTGILMAD